MKIKKRKKHHCFNINKCFDEMINIMCNISVVKLKADTSGLFYLEVISSG